MTSSNQGDDVFLACRKGDLERVRYLTDQKEINLNVRDKWDSTPLYYACLCGHPEVVSYLLENGARCEANTFDGERCVYGALTDQIRKMLNNFSVISSRVRRREPFHEFLRRLLEEGENTDITFVVNGTHIKAHRFVLTSRSDYFEQQILAGRWKNRDIVFINNSLVDSSVFYRMIEWLYTGQVKFAVSQYEDALRLCKQCRLEDLEQEIQSAFIKADSFVASKRGCSRIKHFQIESQKSQKDLMEDLSVLAMLTLPYEFQFQWHYWMELPMRPKALGCNEFIDIIFRIGSHIFQCHKAMFCTRSDYFKALIDDHFQESSWDSSLNVPVIDIHNVEPDVFAIIVNHVYSNIQHLSLDNVYDVIEVAEMFFLPDLKKRCGVFLTGFLEVDNAVDQIFTARLFNIPKLEHSCVDFMAKNIEEMVKNEKFKELVLNDARNVKSREETDSIDIVDEIRYVLRTSNLNSLSSITEAELQLECLDSFLEELNLEA